MRNWRKNHRERYNEIMRNYRKNHREIVSRITKKSRLKCKERDNQLRRLQDISNMSPRALRLYEKFRDLPKKVI